MKPKRIILIRHGESEGNVNRKIYENVPDYQLALSQKGKEQAIQCGKDLKKIIGTKSCFFYVSPFKRTRETFQLISRSFDKNQIQKREDPRIREQEWGHLKTVKELKLIDAERAAYGNFFYRIPDGESCADVYDRMSSFFNCLHRNFDKDSFPENCFIITHGMTIRVFLMRWFHWEVEEFSQLKNPKNCEVIILEKNSNEKFELASALRTK